MHEPCWQLTCYSQRQQEIVVTPEFFQAVPLGEKRNKNKTKFNTANTKTHHKNGIGNNIMLSMDTIKIKQTGILMLEFTIYYNYL